MKYNKHQTAAGLTTSILRGDFTVAASRFLALSDEQQAHVLPLVEKANTKTDFDTFQLYIHRRRQL